MEYKIKFEGGDTTVSAELDAEALCMAAEIAEELGVSDVEVWRIQPISRTLVYVGSRG